MYMTNNLILNAKLFELVLFSKALFNLVLFQTAFGWVGRVAVSSLGRAYHRKFSSNFSKFVFYQICLMLHLWIYVMSFNARILESESSLRQSLPNTINLLGGLYSCYDYSTLLLVISQRPT